MIRWVVVVFLALILINGLLPLLKRFGVGRIPGDFELKAFGRVWPIPLGSTLVLSGLLSLLTRWFFGCSRRSPVMQPARARR